MRIIFFALLAGVLLFCAVTVFLITRDGGEVQTLLGSTTNDLLAMGGYVLAMIFLSRFIDGMWQKQIPTVLKVGRSPLSHYRSNVIIRLALLEGGALLTVVMALVTRNPQLLIATALAVGAMWLAQPKEEEFLERYDQRA